MVEQQERRSATRIALLRRLSAQARGTHEVWLVDLSLSGARITLAEQLVQGSQCSLELPPALGGLTLSTRVVWSGIFGAEQTAEGERHLIYQSGLAFESITADQQATLGGILAQLTPGRILKHERVP
ncbi:MAG TPA: PilZ domain-containing protein [Candidatus Methylomirabilis sp.]|nr:PilZ domain-containing protein [Candidatus Methylomirabilis sp.]